MKPTRKPHSSIRSVGFVVPVDEASVVPLRFSAYIGGFMGTSCQIDLMAGVVAYSVFAYGSATKVGKITPTVARWQEFRRTLDSLEVWKWRRDYPNTGTTDGTNWSLDIAYDDRSLKSRGDNNYPDTDGIASADSEPTRMFNKYLAAVEKLLGGIDFA